MKSPLDVFRYTRPGAGYPGAPKPPAGGVQRPTVGIAERRSAEGAMELLEDTIAKMLRGEALLHRNRWNRETQQPERIESPCYWPRVESMWLAVRDYPLFDAEDNPIPGSHVFEEADLPITHAELHALWSTWWAGRGF